MKIIFKLRYIRLLILKLSGKDTLIGTIRSPKNILGKIRSRGIRKTILLLRAVLFQNPEKQILTKVRLNSLQEQRDLLPYGSRRFTTRFEANEKKSVFMITDSLSDESLFGGVLTSILFCLTLAARTDRNLKIITTQNMSQLGDLKAFLQSINIENEIKIDYLFRPEHTLDPITITENDIFVPTSSWTCHQAISSFPNKKIFYILQEDERLFFPSGDKSNLAFQAMNNSEINYIINTECLREYLIKSGFQHLALNSASFEPSFQAVCTIEKDSIGRQKEKKKRIFTFYARPDYDRNMYLTGVKAIEDAFANGVLNQEGWEIHFIGINNFADATKLGFEPIVKEKMDYFQYIHYLQDVDIGMALMASPHPGYPALDFAAAGAKSITNSWPGKMNFDLFGDSVFVAEGTPTGIAAMIEKAVDSLQLSNGIDSDYEIHSPYSDPWVLNFDEALRFVEIKIANV